ncbi:DNA adenine methylase [Tsukamurella spumae]|uniref:DNA adenine methylase n=1 Tax=Tsukamurella spumae TaxID=44753 RepID=UPI0028AD0F8C|nr:DNA adenine methylase [Tsukamurella spumae]
MRSPIPYYGSKARLADNIVSLMPEHRRYVEPYCGGLSVLLAKPQCRSEVVNDLDQSIMTFWRVLRDQPDELARVCALTPHSREERNLAKSIPADLDDIEVARRVWSALVQGRAGTLINTGWKHSTDSGHYPIPRSMSTSVERMAEVSERLRGVSLECRPALEVIARYGGDMDTLLYVDPPYLGETRRRNYRVEMAGARAHRELATALRECRATVILSGYESELYAELFADWHRTEFLARTEQSPIGRDGSRTEVVWSNREFRYTGGETDDGCNETRPSCGHCGRVIPKRSTGRPARFCSGACRVAAHRARASAV